MSGSWLDQLQPASWRGLPFAVKASEYPRGRRFALHEYPYRDLPWAEDTGRATRAVAFSGFVVGDDCYAQAQALLDAAEQPGSGTLVHPSLGELTVALIEPLHPSERFDLGRVVELRFAFVETGTPLYPSDATSTQADVSDKATAAQAASASDFNAAAGQDNNGTSTVNLGTGQGSTTYTDSKGSVTLVPTSTGTTPYQETQGGQTVRLFGDGAVQQASSPALTANAAVDVPPLAGTTYGRFDGIGSLSVGSTDQALDGQIANRAAVSDAALNAALKAGA